MKYMPLILGIVWALLALAMLLVTIADFYVGKFPIIPILMTVGCGGASAILFLQYFWNTDEIVIPGHWKDDDE